MKIDLSKLPEGTKWIAIDDDGTFDVAAYSIEPFHDATDLWYSAEGFISFINGHD